MKVVNNESSRGAKIKRLLDLADAYGEINRGYSRDFPDRLVQCLQKRITEIERIARFIIKNDPGIKHEFKEALLSIRSRFSGKNATNIKRVF
jgi:hypothetical protein